MSHSSAPQPVRRLVLVPTTAPGRDDELIRRYRLARLRLIGRETALAARREPQARAT
jgi:hypothetical protein